MIIIIKKFAVYFDLLEWGDVYISGLVFFSSKRKERWQPNGRLL